MNQHQPEIERIETDLIEWAIRCRTRAGEPKGCARRVRTTPDGSAS